MLDPHALPDWLYLFEDDFESLLDCRLRRSSARPSNAIAARSTTGSAPAGSTRPTRSRSPNAERLQLVARTFELVRSLDPDTPALVSFDQPWAEYLRQRESDFPPLHFADALIRAGLDLARPDAGDQRRLLARRHAACATPLEFSRQLDAWSLLGLPLWLSLSAPSGDGDDPLAQHNAIRCDRAIGPRRPSRRGRPATCRCALAKPMVQGVFWNQLRDSQPHDFPHGGLFDARSKAKPALRTLAAIRQAYLK